MRPLDHWDERFLDLVAQVASWSKDRSTKVGAVVVRDRRVLSTGYNGFPRDVDDEEPERHERPAKYLWTEHAERNAVYNAAREGTSLAGATMYLEWFPCADCARAVVQSGVTELVCSPPDPYDERWADSFRVAGQVLAEAGVELVFHCRVQVRLP